MYHRSPGQNPAGGGSGFETVGTPDADADSEPLENLGADRQSRAIRGGGPTRRPAPWPAGGTDPVY